MPHFECKLYGSRTTNPVKGRLILTVEAPTADEARELINDSLPGFDWQWESAFGVTLAVVEPHSYYYSVKVGQ